MKILIIEDEPSLRELIQRSLEKERYVVEAAADFQSGLRKIEDYDYDCGYLSDYDQLLFRRFRFETFIEVNSKQHGR